MEDHRYRKGYHRHPSNDRERRSSEQAKGYNTQQYYQANQNLANSRYPSRDSDNFGDTQYDDLNTGKYENYNGGGYYGSQYGSINNLNTGRDYEQNAGYRDNYNKLTEGQWPEIEQSQRRKEQRNPQGENRGKGPRSYQRPDVRIRESINDLLYEDHYIDATHIEVEVKDGEVTLTGSVADRNMKRRAEDLAESVSGVKHLENRLRTARPGGDIVNIKNSEV